MIKAEIYKNLTTVSDDDILQTFSYVSVATGIFYDGLFEGDREMRADEQIDNMIYKLLSKIENKK